VLEMVLGKSSRKVMLNSLISLTILVTLTEGGEVDVGGRGEAGAPFGEGGGGGGGISGCLDGEKVPSTHWRSRWLQLMERG